MGNTAKDKYPPVEVLARQYGVDEATAATWIAQDDIPHERYKALRKLPAEDEKWAAALFKITIGTLGRWSNDRLPYRIDEGKRCYIAQAALAWLDGADPEQLVTTGRFAGICELSTKHGSKLATTGKIPSLITPGGSRLIRLNDAYRYRTLAANPCLKGELPPSEVLQLQYGIKHVFAQEWIELDEIPLDAYTAILCLPWIGIAEVASLFAVASKSVKRWPATRLPYWQTSTLRKRYPLQGVLAWLGGKRPAERLLNLGEVATQCAVNPRAVRHWVELGKLHPHQTPGGHDRFRPAEVRAFHASRLAVS